MGHRLQDLCVTLLILQKKKKNEIEVNFGLTVQVMCHYVQKCLTWWDSFMERMNITPQVSAIAATALPNPVLICAGAAFNDWRFLAFK